MEGKLVAGLAKQLGVTQQPAIGKGTELLRLLKLKHPGSFGGGEACRPAVCLELACTMTPGSKLPMRQEFQRYSCVPAKMYNEVFLKVQGLLDVQRPVDLRELATCFGCSDVQDFVQQLLRAYKARYTEELASNGTGSQSHAHSADFSRPVFLAAAFFLAARKKRAKIDKAALLTKMGVDKFDFNTTSAHMAELCADILSGASEAGPRTRADGSGAQRGGARKRGGAAASEWPGEEPQEDVALEAFKLVVIGKHKTAPVPVQRQPAGDSPQQGHGGGGHDGDLSGGEQDGEDAGTSRHQVVAGRKGSGRQQGAEQPCKRQRRGSAAVVDEAGEDKPAKQRRSKRQAAHAESASDSEESHDGAGEEEGARPAAAHKVQRTKGSEAAEERSSRLLRRQGLQEA